MPTSTAAAGATWRRPLGRYAHVQIRRGLITVHSDLTRAMHTHIRTNGVRAPFTEARVGGKLQKATSPAAPISLNAEYGWFALFTSGQWMQSMDGRT